MKKKTFQSLIILFFIFSINLSAQKSFIPGYIVTNYEDTIFGKLKDRKDGIFINLYGKIRFKPSKGIRKRFAPNDIKAYRIGNQSFITMDIKDEIVFFKRKVVCVPNSNNKQFIKVVSEGYLSWYEKEYVDDSGLSSTIYFKRNDENEMVFVRSGIFGLNKKTLAEYFNDCPELSYKILNKAFKSPEEVFRFYNNWYQRKY